MTSFRRFSLDRRAGSASGRIITAMDSTLHLLGHELHVASVPKDSLSVVTHSLLQLLLRLFRGDSGARRSHFFSFTETDNDYSIILDTQLLHILTSNSSANKIEVDKAKWRPLVVEVGALGSLTGLSKIAASVIGPLADHDVSVFCLSTNQEDYVMVREEDLEKALQCLSKKFRLTCDSDRKSDLSLLASLERRIGSLDSAIKLQPITKCCHDLPRPIVHPYTCSRNKFSICSIVPRSLPSVGTLLLDLMLYNRRSTSDDVFFSLSVVDDDISVVLDSRDLARFPEDALYFSEGSWRLIKIGEGPLGFDECGIVAQVSAPLAQAEISTYYICTYYTDNTLIPEESVGEALRLLNERLAATTCAENGLRTAESLLDSPVLLNGAHS